MYRNSRKRSPLLGIALIALCAAAGMIIVGASSDQQMSLLGTFGLALLGIAAGLMLLYVAWRVVLLMIAKPTIKVDYLADANRVLRPADYDPNRNAFGLFEKFCRQWAPAPSVSGDWRAWPTDLSPPETAAFRKWAPINESLLPLLKEAAQCPHLWHELKSTKGSLTDVDMPALKEPRQAAWGVILLAKHRAAEGDVGDALDMLTDLHGMGVHYSRGPTLVEQMVGLAFCEMTYSTVLTVLDRCHPDTPSLGAMLRTFRARLPLIDVPRFSEAEYFHGKDLIQRHFTDDGEGDGILIMRALYARKKNAVVPVRALSYLGALAICFHHPRRSDTTSLHDTYFAAVKMAAVQAPWQLHVQNASCEMLVDQLLRGNYFLREELSATSQCVRRNWQTRTLGQAFVTILAILMYKAEQGRLPTSLDDLVTEGHIESVPIDPYSGKPFVYRVVGTDFILYSVGEDFVDDGGVPASWEESRNGGDRVFWPVQASSAGTP